VITPRVVRSVSCDGFSKHRGRRSIREKRQPVVSMLRQLRLVRCILIVIVCAIHTCSDVTDDVRDDDVRESPRSAPSGRGGEICDSCPSSHEVLHQLPQADVIRLHVERIKRELLRKLGLSAAPSVAGTPLPSIHSFPRPLLSSRDDVTDDADDGTFSDYDIMSDDVGSSSQQLADYYYDVDDDDEYEDEEDYDEDGLDGELDVDDDELGPPAPPPRSKQIIVFGQQRMSTVYALFLQLRILI